MRLPRRTFLRKAAVAALGFTIVPRHVLGRGFVPPSETLNHVIVGCGGISAMHSEPRMTGKNRIVGICDVDAQHMQKKLDRIKQAGGGTPMSVGQQEPVHSKVAEDLEHLFGQVAALAAGARHNHSFCTMPTP